MSQSVRGALLGLVAFFCFLLWVAPAKGETPALKPGDVFTIAGQNIYDNGPATQARLATSYARGMARDAAGNIYFSDAGNHRVRKVDINTGIITTVVGSGPWGYGGDGGLATAATLRDPMGLAFDAAGNLYIADAGNNRIRKVTPAGVITTVAGNGTAAFSGDGGPAEFASLNYPRGVIVDASGNLYIADSNNYRVRKMSGGIITTVAGTGVNGSPTDGVPPTASNLPSPYDVAVDPGGNLLIALRNYSRISKVDFASNSITTVAYPSCPEGMTFDGGYLYVAEACGNRVTRYDGGYNATYVAGGYSGAGFGGDGGPATSALMSAPSTVILDPAKNIYVYDSGNLRIRRVDAATGNIDTFAGSGSIGDDGPATDAVLADPLRAVVDRAGNVYIADVNNRRVRRVDAATGIITTYAGNGSNSVSGDGFPAIGAGVPITDIAIDADDNILIGWSNRVRRVDAATGIITTIAGGVSYGAPVTDGAPALSAYFTVSSLAVDGDNNIYIGDGSNRRIRMIDAATGLITTVAGSGASTTFADGVPALQGSVLRPMALAVDVDKNIYIGDLGDYRVKKVEKGTGLIRSIAGTGVSGYSGDGGLAVNAALVPRGVAVDGNGNIYASSGGKWAGGAMAVRRITPDGRITTFAGGADAGFSGDGGAAANALLSRPRGVSLDRQGNIYIADTGNNRIRKVLALQADTTAPAVTVSPVGRSYSSPQVVTLAAGEPATIYCTTDGSDPVTSGTRMTFDTVGQLPISQPTILRYYAVDRAGNAGIVGMQQYQITYEQPADPSYISTDTLTGVTLGSRTENTYVTLTNGMTMKFDGYGDYAGENSIVFDRSLQLKSGSYAGWYYGVGHYDFSGRRGTVYFTRYGREYRMALLGDIHGVLLAEGGDLVMETGSATLYVTSVGSAAAPAAVHLYGRVTSEGDGGTVYPDTPVTITERTASVVLSGYSDMSYELNRPLIALTLNGVSDSVSIADYSSSQGVGKAFVIHNGGVTAGVYEGPLFGLRVHDQSADHFEHVLAAAPRIAAGSAHAAAVKNDGSLWSWGDNSYGELGLGTTVANSMPKLVLSGVREVAPGARHTLAVDGNGTVLAWGNNATGALGTGDNADRFLPAVALTGKSIRSVAAGNGFSLALDLNGGVFAWGDNSYGRLGNGSSVEQAAIPQSVLLPSWLRISAVAAGDGHALALDSDGTIWGWGSNARGQLGSDQLAFASLPVNLPEPWMVSAVAAGGEHSLALDFYGTVWAWGGNSRGQLGNGGTLDSATPQRVQGLSGVVAIAAGFDHSLALKRDGTVWAWGGNGRGQLGNNDPQKRDSSLPVQVANLSGMPQGGIVSIAAGNAFSVAQKYDGTVLTWGSNSARQLAVTHVPELYYVGLSRMNVADTVPPTVTASPAGGSFGAPITVTLTSSESTNGTIFYTKDGSDPAVSPTRKIASGVSSVSVPITSSCTLRYYAVDGGSNPSRSYSEEYVFSLAPSISGTPATTAATGFLYSFTPTASAPSGTISYGIVNKPSWASFNTTTGALTGYPAATQVGTYGGIVISATANGFTASLSPFSITVTPQGTAGAATFVAINGGAQAITGTSVTLNLGCTPAEKCAQMQFSNDDLIWSSPEPFAATKSWMVPSGDGLKTVYVKFLDQAGNPGNTYFAGAVLTGTTPATGSYLFDGKWGRDSSGNGTFLLPGAVAWSRSDGAVYVADSQNCRIQKFDAQLKFVAKWGGCGPGDGQFLGMNGVATDSLGNVYVTDAKNRIQKFAPDGSFITKWNGTGTAVTMIAVDRDDTVYVTGSGKVQLFDRNGGFLREWEVYLAGNGLAVDSRKNVYVRSANNVWEYDNAGTLLLSWSLPYGTNVSGLGYQSGFAYNPYNGYIAVADAQAHVIRFYTPPDSDAEQGGGAPTQVLTWGEYGSGPGQLNRPQHVAFDDQGNMFVADTGNQRVLKLAPPYSGTPISVGAPDTDARGFNIPVSVSVDPATGNVFVADLQNDRVQQFSSSGSFLAKFGTTGTGEGLLRVPLDAVADGRGNLYVLDGGNNRIQKFSVATGAVVAAFGSELSSPRRIALDRNGNLYVAQYNQITKYDQNGTFLTSWGNYIAATNNGYRAAAIAVDTHGPTDVVCIIDSAWRRIVKFDVDGNYLGSVGDGLLSNMMSLAVDGAGYLYVYDNSVGAINKFDPLGNLVTLWGTKAAVLDGSMRFAMGLAVDSAGTVFVADSYNNRIQKFVAATIPNGSATINSGSSTTVSRFVDLTLSARSNGGVVQSMRFSNDNISWSPWEPYATVKSGWELPDREGANYVYVQFRNSYGSISQTVKCSIILKYQLFTVVTAPVDSYTPVSVTPTMDASMQVTFQSVLAAAGNSGVQVTAAVTPPPPPQDLKVYNSQVYEIQAPGVTFAGGAEVCLAFRPSAVSNPDNMKIMHYVDPAWQDITTSRTYNLDNDTGRVCGHTDSFSPFMTGETVSAADGVCGAANGGTFASIPVDFLCTTGTPSTVSGTGPWNWNCSGTEGGAPASCSAQKLVYTEPPVTSATPAGGEYSGTSLLVTLKTTNNAVIRYTTNGSTPTNSSPVFTSSLLLTGNVTLKYFATDESGNVEQVRTSTYTIRSASQPSGSYAGTKVGSTFAVLRSEGGKPFTTVVANTTSTSFTDGSKLKPNTIYQYAVTSDADPTRSVFMTVRTPLYNGWNIFAVPYGASGVAPASFFAAPVGPVYQWLPTGPTPENSASPLGRYVTASGVDAGLGYFVKTTKDGTMLSWDGTPGPTVTSVVLKPGWTMISNPAPEVKSGIAANWLVDGAPLADAIVANRIGGGIYWWNGTTYDSWSIINNDPRIEPWKGYWMLNLDGVDHTLTIQ